MAAGYDSAKKFQSTLPVGGATQPHGFLSHLRRISIHAPRGGSDYSIGDYLGYPTNFNPRSPWGERPARLYCLRRIHQFQSTLPVGGATIIVGAFSINFGISIHAPRGGSDVGCETLPCHRQDFNPRSPWGERPSTISLSKPTLLFQSTLPVGGATNECNRICFTSIISIHAPRGGSDDKGIPPVFGYQISIHAPRGGSDFLTFCCRPTRIYFNPRSPWGERQT